MDKSWTAGLALVAACVVFTGADQEVGVVGVASVACVGVAITHASASDGNILNTVEVLEGKMIK